MQPYTQYRNPIPGVTQAVNSDQATSRHTEEFTYRCFLPDLTRFMSFRCVRPNRQRHLLGAGPTIEMPPLGIQSCYSGLQVIRGRQLPIQHGKIYKWRRKRDSNPRNALAFTRFPGERLQPLGHFSLVAYRSILYLKFKKKSNRENNDIKLIGLVNYYHLQKWIASWSIFLMEQVYPGSEGRTDLKVF